MLFAPHLLHDERTLEPEEDFEATMECFASHLLHDKQYPSPPHHSSHHLKDNYIPKTVTPKNFKNSNDVLGSLSYAGHFYTPH